MEKRQCDPRFVVKVWKKILNLEFKNKSPLWSILRTIKPNNETDDSFDLKIDMAIGDGLLQVEVKNGEQHLRIPTSVADSLHDWYCYRCHNPGLLKDCESCWRAYHLDCFNQKLSQPSFTCPQCNKINANKPMSTRRSLNHLLAGILIRLRQETSILYNLSSSSDLAAHFNLIFKTPMDLDTIQSKVENDVYISYENLNEDLRILQHNVILAFGDKSEESQLMKLIFTDFHTEISRLKECEDCYFVSYCRFGSWFCYPCDPEHEIVYAKVRGFNFWPAKVISIASNKDYDVRFFGGNHERAIVQGSSIRPITANRDQLLGNKKTEALKQACRELDEYLELQRLGTKIQTPSDHLLKLLKQQNDEIAAIESANQHSKDEKKKNKDGASTSTSASSSFTNDKPNEPAIAKIRISLSKTMMDSVVVLKPLNELTNGNHKETESKSTHKIINDNVNIKKRKNIDDDSSNNRNKDNNKRNNIIRNNNSFLKKNLIDEDLTDQNDKQHKSANVDKFSSLKSKSFNNNDITGNINFHENGKNYKNDDDDAKNDDEEDNNEISTGGDDNDDDYDAYFKGEAGKKRSKSDYGVNKKIKNTEQDVQSLIKKRQSDSQKCDNMETKSKTTSETRDSESKPKTKNKLIVKKDKKKKHDDSVRSDVDEDIWHDGSDEDYLLKLQKERKLLQIEQRKLMELKADIELKEKQLKFELEEFQKNVSEIKKKQWCFTCEKPADYYCCWNTAYCSQVCQKEHWINGHRSSCRRRQQQLGGASSINSTSE